MQMARHLCAWIDADPGWRGQVDYEHTTPMKTRVHVFFQRFVRLCVMHCSFDAG